MMIFMSGVSLSLGAGSAREKKTGGAVPKPRPPVGSLAAESGVAIDLAADAVAGIDGEAARSWRIAA
jgi:hypothetical protein